MYFIIASLVPVSSFMYLRQTRTVPVHNDISVTCHFRVPPSMSNVSEAIMSNSKYILVTFIDRAGGI